MKKDKKKIIGETLSDERIKELLAMKSPAGESRSFHILTRAYRTLRQEDFSRFILFYAETGLELNPCNRSGRRFLDVLSRHQHAMPYIQTLHTMGIR